MLSQEDNDLLTHSGPATPMGQYLRRFWMPVLLSRELPEPDCPPKKVTVLGEDLLAFRDTQGRIGLVDPVCPHRGANLYYGRNEECGLLLPFVMPLMRSAKALARTLAGDPTDVVFPCMPVVAKTPSFPVVVAPVVDGSPFRWEKAGEGSGHRAWCKDANDQVRGFALGGEAVGERFRWERSVAAWLAADAPISEAAPVQASNP